VGNCLELNWGTAWSPFSLFFPLTSFFLFFCSAQDTTVPIGLRCIFVSSFLPTARVSYCAVDSVSSLSDGRRLIRPQFVCRARVQSTDD